MEPRKPNIPCLSNMSYSLKSLKGGYIGDDLGTTIGLIKGDTGSLDYGSYAFNHVRSSSIILSHSQFPCHFPSVSPFLGEYP